MSRHHARTGDGSAWLVADRREPPGYHCYWYTGPADDHLVEHADVVGATEAVAWGEHRTPNVRIRLADAATTWAGSAARPEGITGSWDRRNPTDGDPQC